MDLFELFFPGWNITYYDGSTIFSGDQRVGSYDGAFIYAIQPSGQEVLIGNYVGDSTGGLIYHHSKLVGNYDGMYFYNINERTPLGEYTGDVDGGPVICYKYARDVGAKDSSGVKSNNTTSHDIGLEMLDRIKSNKKLRKKYLK